VKLARIGSLLLGIVLLAFGAYLVQDGLEHRGGSSRGKQGTLVVFVGGIFFLARAAIPPDDDDQDRMF